MISNPGDNEIIPRYEFRTFGPELGDILARIQRHGSPTGAGESSEIYLVSKTEVLNSLKIRDHELEMKSLLNRVGPLELWEPRFKLIFPLSPGIIKSHVFAVLAVDPPELDEATMIDEQTLIEDILCFCPQIRPAWVYKQRSQFLINNCRTEHVELLIEGRSMESVAIEDEEAEKVLQLRETLGLSGTENISYMKKLNQVINHSQSAVN